MRTIILFCPVTNSEYLICLDQVIYVYEITNKRSKYFGCIKMRFEDGSTQIFKANYLDVIEAFTVKTWFESTFNSLMWWIKSKRLKKK
jgi:hypothetical protein